MTDDTVAEPGTKRWGRSDLEMLSKTVPLTNGQVMGVHRYLQEHVSDWPQVVPEAKRWVGYIRTTDHEGALDELAAIRAYVRAADGCLVATYFDLTDADTFGVANRRYGLWHGWSMAEAAKARLLMGTVGALSSSLVDSELLRAEVERVVPITFITAPESSAARDAVAMIAALACAGHHSLARVRMDAGRRRKTLVGDFGGGKVPYGMMIDDKRNLVTHPVESKLIGEGIEMRKLGCDYVLIGRYWAANGMPPRRAAVWRRSSVVEVINAAPRRGITPVAPSAEAMRYLSNL